MANQKPRQKRPPKKGEPFEGLVPKREESLLGKRARPRSATRRSAK